MKKRLAAEASEQHVFGNSSAGTKVTLVFLLCWYKSTNTDAALHNSIHFKDSPMVIRAVYGLLSLY
jgi:hypothetical protein